MSAAGDIRDEAARLGFDAVRFTPARLPAAAGDDLDRFLSRGYAGDMGWLALTRARRRSPERMWPDAKTAIVLGANYGPAGDPLAVLEKRDRGAISVYAQNDDYHDVVKKRLKALARRIAGRYGAEVKVFVDTAPLMEKPLAERAGLGWQGKHTNLVSRDFGSWLFLGTILTTLDLPADPPEVDHCGSCRACLDVCPTGAFPAPGEIDARRCISYLTIEHKGPIPRELRPLMGNRVYGCDDCLAVCPWNKFARQTEEPSFLPRAGLAAPRLAEFAALDDAGFRALFRKSAVKRIGRDRFVRNVLIAIGNSGRPELAEAAEKLLRDESALVRGAAVWALRQLDPERATVLQPGAMAAESEPDVRAEWALAYSAATATPVGQVMPVPPRPQ
ncbi:MAG: tRNA epoxyqueuosine(34) reductase QueG [Rhodospirillaceae bacterium]|nr:tRNA epoxyqueuosine(34) reductase QueG [Rhodospirillaceae bacterium]MYF87408.1 tRNA epoxyqueuosine(34) reductase QueG [Rhodospirillaceae bacterium]MYK14609.1 tRNA epoxyqueuosine(34) reductase QueG [Rhodospirillaceae bacterium]